MVLHVSHRSTTTSSSFHTKWKPGDWRCAPCGAHNFANRIQCFRCCMGKSNATNVNHHNILNTPSWKKGDWNCDNCSKHNFATRKNCFSCGVNREVSEANADAKVKKHLVLDYISRLTKKICPRKGVSLKKSPPLSKKEFKAANSKKSLAVMDKNLKERWTDFNDNKDATIREHIMFFVSTRTKVWSTLTG